MIKILNGDVELYNVDFSDIIPVANIYLPEDDTPTDLPVNPSLITLPECDDDLNVFYCGSLIYDSGAISKFNDGYSYIPTDLSQSGLIHAQEFKLVSLKNVVITHSFM